MRIVAPHMGNIYVVLRTVFEEANIEYVIPPPSTTQTLDLGVRYSPESICLPYKLTLGNFIEGLRMGADTLLFTEAPGTCRLGYYFKLQKQTLKDDLKFSFQTVTMEEHSLQGLLGIKKVLAPKLSWLKTLRILSFAFAKLRALDQIERLSHKLRPREMIRGTVTDISCKAARAIDHTSSFAELKQVRRDYREELLNIETNGVEPLKVGLIGEFFIVLDPFSNYHIETELGKLGVEVNRSLFLSKWIWTNLPFIDGLLHRKVHRAARPYLGRDIGGDGWESVGERTLSKYDGLVHLYPFGCMPEIVAMNIMKSMKNKVPVLHISCDEQTAKAGMLTRLEAFIDMLRRKRADGVPRII